MRRSARRLLAPISSPVILSLCAAVALSLTALPALAVIQFNGGAGMSGYSNATTPVTYYGGIAGVKFATNLNPAVAGGTIDTCAFPPTGVKLFACNNAAILPSTNLVITFESTTVDGVPSITYVPTGSTTATAINTTVLPSVTHNNYTSVSIPWSTICNLMATNNIGVATDCSSVTTPGTAATFQLTATITGNTATTTPSATPGATTGTTDTGTFSITVIDGDPGLKTDGSSVVEACDPNTPSLDTGICHFELLAGDSSAKIQTLYSSASFPNLYGVPITNVIALYSEGKDSFANIGPPALNSSNFFKMGVAPDSTSGAIALSPQIITGLNNDNFYSFKIALEDAAGNIGFYTASDDVTTTDPVTGPDYSCIFTSNPTGTTCHEPEPGAVVGVLSQNINCFIATAAYGSPLAPQIQILREFRDRIMIPTGWGRRFVRYYYKNGPIYARYIAEKDLLRAFVRATLWPVVGFAHLALKIGFKTALSLILLSILAVLWAGLKGWRMFARGSAAQRSTK